MKKNYSLTIGWLYPDLMSTYGDRGNIIILQKRCEWRDIDVSIERISIDTKPEIISSCDLLFMGGAQDTQQEIVEQDLKGQKGKLLQKAIENEIPGLYICGAYQFLGNYYKDADGKKIEGLEIFDLYTVNPGNNVERLIGNTVIRLEGLNPSMGSTPNLVGFENHGGRTYLGENIQPLGKVIKGFGNNGEDGMEGAIYKNSIGSYFHGPILPKNPQLADWLIKTALEKKYQQNSELKPLDDTLEIKAHDFIAKRLDVEL